MTVHVAGYGPTSAVATGDDYHGNPLVRLQLPSVERSDLDGATWQMLLTPAEAAELAAELATAVARSWPAPVAP